LIVNASGRNGGPGGKGGLGGNGSYMREGLVSETLITCGDAGDGGQGGPGGPGGRGGNIVLASLSSTTVPESTGGKSGMGGPGNNEPGRPRQSPLPPGPRVFIFRGCEGQPGKAGSNGGDGQSGRFDTRILTPDQYWSELKSKSFAASWAKYRHNVGEFYIRRWIPGVTGRDHYISLAVDEFEAARHFNPAQAESEF